MNYRKFFILLKHYPCGHGNSEITCIGYNRDRF